MLTPLIVIAAVTTNPTPLSVFGLDIAVSRDWVADNFGDLNKLSTHHRIVPAFRDGRQIGFKMFSIKPGSPYALLGFQNGDVVERVNGQVIDSPDRALEVYRQLRSASTVVLDIRRRGKRVILRYYIRWTRETSSHWHGVASPNRPYALRPGPAGGHNGGLFSSRWPWHRLHKTSR